MTDQRIRLRHEIDFSQSIQGSKRMEAQLTRSHGRVNRAVKTTAGEIARAAPAITGAMAAATASIAAQEQSWVSLGGAVAGAFAAGGLLGGGIALIGASIGFLAKSSDDGGAAASKLGSELKALEAQTVQMERRLLQARGVNLLEEDARKAAKALDDTKNKLKALQDRRTSLGLGQTMGGPNSIDSQRGVTGNEERIRKLNAEIPGLEERLKKLREQVALQQSTDAVLGVKRIKALIGTLKDRNAVLAETDGLARKRLRTGQQVEVLFAKNRLNTTKGTKKEREQAEELNKTLRKTLESFKALGQQEDARKVAASINKESDAINRRIALLRAQSPLEKQLLDLRQRRAEAIRRLGTISGDDEGVAGAKVTALSRVKTLFDLQEKRVRESFTAPFDRFVDTIPGSLGNAIGQGVSSGFRGFEQVGLNLLRSIAGQGASLIATGALNSLFGNQERGLSSVFRVAGSRFPGLIPLNTGGLTRRDGPAFPHKNEFVAPVDRLRQMIREEVRAAGGAGGGVNVSIDAEGMTSLGYRSPNAPLVRALRTTSNSRTLRDKRRRGY